MPSTMSHQILFAGGEDFERKLAVHREVAEAIYTTAPIADRDTVYMLVRCVIQELGKPTSEPENGRTGKEK